LIIDNAYKYFELKKVQVKIEINNKILINKNIKLNIKIIEKLNARLLSFPR